MSHLDDSEFAAVAAGEQLSSSAAVHVAKCRECAAEVEAMADVAGVLRAGSVELAEPPRRVWSSIEADVAREPRRSLRLGQVALVAASSAVLASAATAVALSADFSPEPIVLAQAGLVSLETDAAAGDARIVEDSDGHLILELDVVDEPVDDAYLEVWLIDESIEGMISLGHLSGSHAEFELPDGFDYGAFPIVDVSVEPLDGNPAHSGVSVTRGVLGG